MKRSRKNSIVVRCKTLIFYEEAEEIYFLFGIYNNSDKGEYCMLGGRMDFSDPDEISALSREVYEESATTIELKNEFIFDSYAFETMNSKYIIFYSKIDYPNYIASLDFLAKRKSFEEKFSKGEKTPEGKRYFSYLEMKGLKWLSTKELSILLSGKQVDGLFLWEDDKSYISRSLPDSIKKVLK